MANRILLVVAVLILLVGCKSLGQYQFTPYDGIVMSIDLKRFAPAPEDDALVFLYFDLQIKNTAQESFNFNPGEMRAEVNGKLSEETDYDSLASVLPERQPLEKGTTECRLYFVFPKDVPTDRVVEFKLIENGVFK